MDKFEKAREALNALYEFSKMDTPVYANEHLYFLEDFINESENTSKELDETISECYKMAGTLGSMAAKLYVLDKEDKHDRFA